jgi:hypothetical protein
MQEKDQTLTEFPDPDRQRTYFTLSDPTLAQTMNC